MPSQPSKNWVNHIIRELNLMTQQTALERITSFSQRILTMLSTVVRLRYAETVNWKLNNSFGKMTWLFCVSKELEERGRGKFSSLV